MSKIKTIFSKLFTKTNLTILVVAIVGLGLYATINMRSKILEAKTELAYLKNLYDSNEKEKARLDSLVNVYSLQIKNRDSLLAERDRKLKTKEEELSFFKDSIQTNLVNIAKVKADSSYKYINSRIQPISDLKYPFDSLQVKTIHYYIVERDGLLLIKAKLENIVSDLKVTSQIKDEQILQLKGLNNVYVDQRDLYKKEIDAYKIQVQGLNKQIKKQKFLKFLSGGTTVGLAGYILIHALIK